VNESWGQVRRALKAEGLRSVVPSFPTEGKLAQPFPWWYQRKAKLGHPPAYVRGRAVEMGKSPLVDGTAELEALVAMVRVTGTVVFDEVKLTLVGLKLQLLCGGRDEHIDGDKVAEPVNPF
jgi:hypothetical protein